jgi:hypothetical protein
MGDVGGFEGYADGFIKMMGIVSRWNKFISGPSQSARNSTDTSLTTDGFVLNYAQFMELAKHVFSRDSSILSSTGKDWRVLNHVMFELNRNCMGCSFLHSKFSLSAEQCTYAFPIMFENGGMIPYHSHVIPALMINQLMSILGGIGNEITTYVLCQGNGIPDAWWDGDPSRRLIVKDARFADYVLGFLFGSISFQTYCKFMLGSFSPGKTVKRLCIWIKDFGHVFMLVWEIRVQNLSVSWCFAVDNLRVNPFRDVLLNRFIHLMGSKFAPHNFKGMREGVTGLSGSQIEVMPDMKCVSFMARSTVYLSMVIRSDLMWIVGKFRESGGIELERRNYVEFERSLLKFVTDCVNRGRTVWLSPIKGAFVDINDVKLLSVLPSAASSISGRIPYVYGGAGMGFVPAAGMASCKLNGKGAYSCAVQSCYPPLAHVRECRLLLEDGLRRLG